MADLAQISPNVETLNASVEELLENLSQVNQLLNAISNQFEKLPHANDLSDFASDCRSIAESLNAADEAWQSLPDLNEVADYAAESSKIAVAA